MLANHITGAISLPDHRLFQTFVNLCLVRLLTSFDLSLRIFQQIIQNICFIDEKLAIPLAARAAKPAQINIIKCLLLIIEKVIFNYRPNTVIVQTYVLGNQNPAPTIIPII